MFLWLSRVALLLVLGGFGPVGRRFELLFVVIDVVFFPVGCGAFSKCCLVLVLGWASKIMYHWSSCRN